MESRFLVIVARPKPQSVRGWRHPQEYLAGHVSTCWQTGPKTITYPLEITVNYVTRVEKAKAFGDIR
jgi:hypothetical protein